MFSSCKLCTFPLSFFPLHDKIIYFNLFMKVISIYKRKEFKTTMLVDLRGQQMMDFFTRGSATFLTHMHYKNAAFHKKLTDGLELSELFVDYSDVFINCLDCFGF